jgi:phosphatidylserine/phosphatidylglycerophosphate/cardiolipin synthase-like enzyme
MMHSSSEQVSSLNVKDRTHMQCVVVDDEHALAEAVQRWDIHWAPYI